MVPVVLNFCGQEIFDLRIRRSIQANKWKLTFNALRVGIFTILSLISATICTVTAATVHQKHTVSAAFLVALTIVPTAFISLSAIQRLLRALRIYGVPHAVKANSKCEFNIRNLPTSSGRDTVLELEKPLDISAEAIGVALSVYERFSNEGNCFSLFFISRL